MPEETPPMNAVQVIRAVVSAYGQIAFGLISILILWVMVVTPELQQNRAERQTLYQAAVAIQAAADATRDAARIVERVANDMTRELDRSRAPR